MILLRYFNREILNMTIFILFVLLLIVISNMFVRYLSIVSVGNIEANAIFKMLSIMLPKYIAYLLPISFFFSILLVYGKLFSNNELPIFFACGNSWFKFINITMIPAIFLCIIELILTLIILPKMDQIYFLLQKVSVKNSLINFIQPGKIIPFNKGKKVVYIKSIDDNGRMYDIFIYQKKNNSNIIITAPKGYAKKKADGSQYLILKSGYYYEITPGNLALKKGYFKSISQFIFQDSIINNNSSIDSISTKVLFNSTNIKDQVELQWRLSFPFTILVSTLIALVLCQVSPHQNRYSKITIALFNFIIYFNFLSLSKSWTNQGILPVWIGLWWVHLFFGCTMILILKKNNGPLFRLNK